MDFLFFIGRARDLALAESTSVLSARFPQATLKELLPSVLLVSGLSVSEAVSLQAILGGVIKVVQVSEELPSDASKETLERSCAAILSTLLKETQKISFGIMEIGRETLPAVELREIKEILSESGFRSRFVEGSREGLSASVLLHQNVEECVILRDSQAVRIGFTVAIQNIDEWTKIDRAKPAADRRHGMLPPKVARMMVNLAIPDGKKGQRLLDPFCGTGTIVLEAMRMGADAIGADLRIEAVGQTQKNCEWFVKEFDNQATFHVAVADATHVTAELLGGKVIAIVAEGYLGPQTPRPGAMPNLMKGMEKLYKGAFKQWREILEPGARIVIALPRMNAGKTAHSLSGLIDSLEEFGYTLSSGPFIYDRPDAIVQREIFVLQYTPVASH